MDGVSNKDSSIDVTIMEVSDNSLSDTISFKQRQMDPRSVANNTVTDSFDKILGRASRMNTTTSVCFDYRQKGKN